MVDEEKEHKKDRKIIHVIGIISIIILVVGIVNTYIVSLEPKNDKLETPQMITEIKIKMNSTDKSVFNPNNDPRIESYWVEFTEHTQNSFADPILQKNFGDCYYEGGNFVYNSKQNEFICKWKEKEIQIEK